MSGWGDWLEKGKKLAATIDEQINQSVGVETTATENAAPATADDLNDAWNDYFDDDILNEPSKDEDEQAIIENFQETTPQDTLSSLPRVEDESIISSVPETVEPPVMQEAEVKEPVATSITDDHFAAPTPEVEESTDQNEGWDDDLHVDSHDMNEVATKPVEQTPSEEFKEKPESKETLSQPMEANIQATILELPEPPVANEASVSPPAEESPVSPLEDSVIQPEIEASYKKHVKSPLHEPEPVVEASPMESEPAPKQSEPNVTVAQETTAAGASFADESFVSQSHTEVDAKVLQLQEESQMAVALLQSQLEDLQVQLGQREDQLTSKAQQLSTMQAMFESEKEELRKKIAETKEEAKRRILKAKERVEAMEKRLANAAKSADEAGAQSEIMAALREEGEKLAHKQSEMEKAVRAAKGETRDLREQLEAETASKEKALAKIVSLEADLKRTKEDLAAARKGESQVAKLDTELLSMKEECERKAATNLSLEQQIKELKAENKELRTEVEQARRGAELENQAESKKLKKEHSEMLSDLENKLRTSEREANLREDALRHEVAEIRKRWQDAVRRADALSMDVQQSTAPLLRQLESLERQSRARATAWAELETKLRSDLDDSVIENEKLMKERNEFKSTAHRLERLMKDRDEEVASSRSKLDDQSVKIKQLETKLSTAEAERQKMKEKYEEIEKVANEGVSKVRSDMMQTVVESEERYRAQIESAEKELQMERDIRSQLERQVEQLLENSGMMHLPPTPGVQTPTMSKEKPMKLCSTQGQAEILANTLTGFDSDDEDGASDIEEEPLTPVGSSSFAAMEELNQRLKGTTAELASLRWQLTESERTRESLMEELIQTRHAQEKLPLFEAKVKDLTEDNREKELEIMGLRQDIQEVGQLYRTQLNALLEEKASSMAADLNGGHKDNVVTNDNGEQPVGSDDEHGST